MRLARNQAIITLLLCMLAFTWALAQNQESGGAPSLGEVARQLKAEREKEKREPAPLYTNDNLPFESSIGIIQTRPSAGPKEKGQPADTKTPAESSSGEHGEKYFRSRAEKLRAQLELHQRQLAVLQQQLGLAKMQYYPDPQKTLEQESTPAFQSDLDKLRSKISDTEKAVADDQKAMDDLQEELRRAGGDPAWIRE